MYATKRKFHNLLNAIASNGSSTSLDLQGTSKNDTTQLTEVESQPKKRRIVEPYSAVLAAERRPRSRDATPASTGADEAKQNTPGTTGPSTLPNFAPWDRGQFLERLKTFRQVDRWGSKPAKINEVQWARRGWSCVGKERVGCVGGCGKESCIKLESAEKSVEGEEADDSLTAATEELLVERYATMIITEHDDGCLWRKRGCNEDIYHLSLNHSSSSIAALKTRYQSLAAIGGEIPSNVRYPDRMNIETVAELAPPDFLNSRPSTTESEDDGSRASRINEYALILAVFGWQADEGHVSGLLTCNTCFRRLGLWLFTKRPRTSATQNAAESGDEEALVTALDVASEHRDYCPWINAATQSGILDQTKPSVRPEDKAGWEILLRVLTMDYQFRQRSNATRPGSQLRATPAEGIEDQAGDDSTLASPPPADDTSVRDQKDKERWAKLRKLKKVFDVKNRKSKKSKP